MENSRMNLGQKKLNLGTSKIVVSLHKINFEEVEDKTTDWLVIDSDQLDLGLAKHYVTQRVEKINRQIDQNYLLYVQGYYTGLIETTYIPFEELTKELIEDLIRKEG